jgi:hypothetical protein
MGCGLLNQKESWTPIQFTRINKGFAWLPSWCQLKTVKAFKTALCQILHSPLSQTATCPYELSKQGKQQAILYRHVLACSYVVCLKFHYST